APHVVLTGGGVVWGEKKIRNNEFSDLWRGKEALLQESYKNWLIVANSGLLPLVTQLDLILNKKATLQRPIKGRRIFCSVVLKPGDWCISDFHLHFPESFHYTFKWIVAAAVEGIEKGSIRIPEQPEFTKGFSTDHKRKFLFGIEDKVNKTVIDPE
ncbi:hypothetical protein, partial [Escherichia coli]|uniref:hypothetical protein n=1 Tax=Escherichia coli TaxID=562 RepID=UPI001365A88E